MTVATKAEEKQLVVVVSYDDHVLESLSILLQAGPYEVALANSMKKAEKLVRALEGPCILLLENDMPECGGVDFLTRLLSFSSEIVTPILICQSDDVTLRVAAMRAGAKYTYVKTGGYQLFYLLVEEVRKQIEEQQRGRIDSLTQIYSAGFGVELAAQELSRLYSARIGNREQRERRTKKAVSCLMFDLDSFKDINDTHGHPVGDEAIKLAVSSAKKHLRRSDIFWRSGGDEFMILMPGVTQEIAEDRARLIADEIRHATFGGELALSVSASIGVVTLQKEDIVETNHNATLQRLIKRADDAMYEVKNSRRKEK